jgi:hypothetical protein
MRDWTGTTDLALHCSRESILGIARDRTGWLVIFCVGLLLAAVVVEQFEDVLEHHVGAPAGRTPQQTQPTRPRGRAGWLCGPWPARIPCIAAGAFTPCAWRWSKGGTAALPCWALTCAGCLPPQVELSFFVPLIMGHGGNTGSQAVTTVIRCGRRTAGERMHWCCAWRGIAAGCRTLQQPLGAPPTMTCPQGAGSEASDQPGCGESGVEGGHRRLSDG